MHRRIILHNATSQVPETILAVVTKFGEDTSIHRHFVPTFIVLTARTQHEVKTLLDTFRKQALTKQTAQCLKNLKQAGIPKSALQS